MAIFKLLSASLLAMAGFGLFHLLGTDIGETLEHFALKLSLDPHNRLIHWFISFVTGIDENELRTIEIGTFCYAFLHTVEGVGLLKGKHWAEYMTIIITASLLPFEIYEIFQKDSWIRIGVLIVNLAVVTYLTYVLWRDRTAHKTQTT